MVLPPPRVTSTSFLSTAESSLSARDSRSFLLLTDSQQTVVLASGSSWSIHLVVREAPHRLHPGVPQVTPLLLPQHVAPLVYPLRILL